MNARPQQQMLERSLGVLVQEGDMVESPLVKVIVFLAGFLVRFPPGKDTQFLPDGKRPPAHLYRMLFLVHGSAKIIKHLEIPALPSGCVIARL